MDYILQYLSFSITYTQLLLTFSAVVTVDRNVFTCVWNSVGGRIQADALQVIVAPLFMLLKWRALLVAPPTVVTLVRFAN